MTLTQPKNLGVSLGVIMLALSVAGPACSQQQAEDGAAVKTFSEDETNEAALKLPTPITSAFEAVNSGDEEGFLSSFCEGCRVVDWGREFVGRDAIKRWSDNEFMGRQISLEVRRVRRDGELYIIDLHVEFGSPPGRPSQFIIELEGDKLKELNIPANRR